jgi:hypothetical protein
MKRDAAAPRPSSAFTFTRPGPRRGHTPLTSEAVSVYG